MLYRHDFSPFVKLFVKMSTQFMLEFYISFNKLLPSNQNVGKFHQLPLSSPGSGAFLHGDGLKQNSLSKSALGFTSESNEYH